MAESSVALCDCSVRTDDVRLCAVHHRYWLGNRRLKSVSSVLRAVRPADYSWIERNRPWVLEIARLRGRFVDTYFSEWLVGPVLALRIVRQMIEFQFDEIFRMAWVRYSRPYDPNECKKYAEDTIIRIAMLLEWWDDQNYEAIAVQKIVYSEADGIAGMYDVKPGPIFDVKCSAKIEQGYAAQLGAYSEYSEGEDVGVIHVTSKKVKLVPFKAEKCRAEWRDCVKEYYSNLP